jgi:hypothetical protein
MTQIVYKLARLAHARLAPCAGRRFARDCND